MPKSILSAAVTDGNLPRRVRRMMAVACMLALGALSSLALVTALSAAPLVGPDVGVIKNVTSTFVEPGDRITYTIAFQNVGTATATGIVLTDVLPAELTALAVQFGGNVIGYSVNLPNYIFTIADLSAGESGAIVIGGTVNPGVTRGSAFTNTVTITASGGDVDPANNQASKVATVADAPLSGLAAANSGPTLLTNATFFSATLTAGTNPVFTWDFGDGNNGSGVNPSHLYLAPGSYSATVTATNNVGSVSASTLVSVVAPNVGITKTVTPATATPGATVTYTLQVSNTGDATATNVVITDVIPTELVNLSVTALGFTITDTLAAPAYVWQASDLPPTAGGAIVIVGEFPPTVTVGSIITNAAEIAADIDWESANRSSQATLTIVDAPIIGLAAINDSPTILGASTQFTVAQVAGTNVSYAWDFGDGQFGVGATPTHTYSAPGVYTATVTATNSAGSVSVTTPVTILAADLHIEKVASAALLAPESTVAYTITFTNAGLLTAASVRITDVMPSELTDIAIRAFGNTTNLVNGATFIWELPTLAPQQGGVILITGRMKPGLLTGAIFTNTVAIGASTVEAGPGANQSAVGVTVGDTPASGLAASNSSPTLLGGVTAFTATATTGDNLVYSWDFGDGQVGSGANPTHLYTVPGIYTATVTATNNTSSLTATTVVHITSAELHLTKQALPAIVGPGDAIEFRLSFTNTGATVAGDVRLTDTFPVQMENVTVAVNGVTVNQSTLVGTTYVWSLADLAPGAVGVITLHGDIAQGTPLDITLANTATISTATPEHNLADNTATASAQVTLAPISGLLGIVTNYQGAVPRIGEILTFIATVQAGTSVSYSWDFGDGATGAGASALHAYARPGVYPVRLTAVNPAGSQVYLFYVMVTENGEPAFQVFLPALAR